MQNITEQTRLIQMAAALAAYAKHIASAALGRVEEYDNVVICNGGYASRAKNMVVPLQPTAPDRSGELANQLIRFYGSAPGWLMWNVFPDALEAGGFAMLGTNPIMEFAGSRPIELPERPEIRMERVQDDAAVRVFETVRERANGRDVDLCEESTGYLNGRALSDELRLWLAYIDNEPIGTAGLFEHGGISLIKNIATLPAFQKRGIGTYLSVYVANLCANIPVLDSDPPAINMYKRLGFSPIGAIHFWAFAEQS